MTLYDVKTPQEAAAPRVDGVNAFIVQANTTTEAKHLARAAAQAVGGGSVAMWEAATVEDLQATPDLKGWVFQITVSTGTPKVIKYTGIAGDTLDLVGAGLAAAGVVLSLTSSYNTSTNVLTVSTIGDGIGDKTLTSIVTPPSGLLPSGVTVTTPYGTKVDGGVSGAVLTQVLSLTWVIPSAIKGHKTKEAEVLSQFNA